MKKILLLIFFLFSLGANYLFAYQPPKELQLNIQFDSAPNKQIHGHIIHFNQTITINPNQEDNNIVASQSEIVKNFPVTVAMLVKSLRINDQQTELEFNLVHYGFLRSGTLLLQPKMILSNGQTGELRTDLFILKVSANWSSSS